MSDVKHRIFVGNTAAASIDNVVIEPQLPVFTFDNTTIKFSTTTRRFDETL